MMRLLMLLVLLVFGWANAAPAQATNYFTYNFDCVAVGCSTPTGPVNAGDVNNATLDTTTKHGGTGSMKLTVTNAQGNTGMKPGGGYAINRTQPVFYRVWMKIDSAYRWGTGNKLMKLNRVKQDNDQLGFSFTTHFQKDRISLSECDTCTPQGSGGDDILNLFYDFDPATNPAVTNWQEYIIEMHYSTGGGTAPGVLDASNGSMKLYVNGVLVSSDSGVSLCCRAASLPGSHEGPVEAWGGIGMNTFPQLNCNPGDTVCGGTIWMDDLSTDTTWNSIFSAVDTTPPAAPTGVTISRPPTPTNLYLTGVR